MTDHLKLNEVDLEVSDAQVAVLTIDAPDRRNALTPELADELIAAIDHITHDQDAKALVVASSGSAFCAGAALGHLDGANEKVLRHIYQAFLRAKDLEIPTVAAVGGPAVGAGLNLAMACDLRVTSPSAVFDSRFAKIGLHPGGGATWLLRSAAGQSVGTAMLLFDQKIRGEEAVARGLSWACVAEDDLLSTAHELAAAAARADRKSVV